jgi:septum formation protein
MSRGNSGIRRLILASGSPRRRQLLPLLGLPFVVKAVAVDEHPLPNEAPTEFVLRMSQAKAQAANRVGPEELIVAADTIVVLDGDILGKPTDPEDAVRMLRRLHGRSHIVYTAISVWHPSSYHMARELGESQVWMRNYTEEEIVGYVQSGDPLDKAGAYAIQHPVFNPVSRVEGCWLNVVGLPLCHLRRALAKFDVVVPTDVPGACHAFSQLECPISSEILANLE